MKVQLMLRSRPTGEDPFTTKDKALLKCLKSFRRTWRVDLSKVGKFDIAQPIAGRSLTRALPKGVSGLVHYKYFGDRDDSAKDDDWVAISFDWQKVDRHYLLDEAAPKLIEAFEAYLLSLTAETLSSDDWANRVITKPRSEFGRFGLADFLDRELCKRAFGMTPRSVQKALKGKVEQAVPMLGGIWVVVARDVNGEKTLKALGADVRRLLPNSPL